MATSRNAGKSLTKPKKPAKPNLLSCLVTARILKTMVATGGTFWKHLRLSSIKKESHEKFCEKGLFWVRSVFWKKGSL